jgi:hypothetical protein
MSSVAIKSDIKMCQTKKSWRSSSRAAIARDEAQGKLGLPQLVGHVRIASILGQDGKAQVLHVLGPHLDFGLAHPRQLARSMS